MIDGVSSGGEMDGNTLGASDGLRLTTQQGSTNGSSSFQSQPMLSCVLLQSLGAAIAINGTGAVEGWANVSQAVDLCKDVVDVLLRMWGQGTWN